jgi:hypothetical protein
MAARFSATTDKQTTTIYTAVVFTIAFNRKIRVVCILTTLKYKTNRQLFFSTNKVLPAHDILAFYQARFQIKFCFREKSLQQQVAFGHQRDDDNGMIRPVEDSSSSNSQVSLIVNPVSLKRFIL